MKKLLTLFFTVCFAGLIFSQEVNTQWTNRSDDPNDKELVHFFVFDGSLTNNTPFEIVTSTFSANEQAFITYHSALDGYPFDNDHPNWRKASMERRNAPTDINYRPEGNNDTPYDDAGIRGLQVKQPFSGDGGENTMFFLVSTFGYKDVVFSFAAMDEGAADALIIDYSVVEGDPEWITKDMQETEFELTDAYQLFEIDFSGIAEVNHNPDFIIRLRFQGDDMDDDDGDRVAFNNIALDGAPMNLDDAVNLDIVSVNDGEQVYVGEPFSVTVYANNEAGTPIAVATDTFVTLELEQDAGGTLTGTMSMNMAAGTYSVTFSDIFYLNDSDETDVIIKATAEGLETAYSDPFNILILGTYELTLSINPVGAGVVTGTGTYSEGEMVTIFAAAKEGYEFVNWTKENQYFASTASYTFQMPDENLNLVAHFVELPKKLEIVSLNEGDTIYVDEPFTISVYTVGITGSPVALDDDTLVTLSLGEGEGTLTGTLTKEIKAGTYSVTFTDLAYDTAEESVVLKAAADDLEPGLTEAFDVMLRTYALELTVNIPGAGTVTATHAGPYAEGEHVTIMATANEGYEFVKWTQDGEEIASTVSHTFAMPAEDIVITANFEEEYTGGPMLVHYWHFNTMTGDEVTEVAPDYSVAGLSALITYPGEGDGYMDARTHRPADPVSNFNLRLGQEPDQGAVLRVRNPADTRELLFEIPSTGYSDLVVTYAVTRSDNGGQFQRFEYSADGGDTWVTVGDDIEVPYIGDGDDVGTYTHVYIDLSEFEEVNDNPDLHFRILSVGEGSDNDSGNQRFDNFTLDAVPLTGGPAYKLSIVSVNDGEPVYVNEAFDVVVQALDESDFPAAFAAEDIAVSLVVETGTGTLSGTYTGVIEEGSNMVNISGILYDIAEPGVVLKAAADDLEDGLTEAFDVMLRTYELELTVNIPGAGTVTATHAGPYAEGEHVTIMATANEGYEFVNWTQDGEEIASTVSHTFAMPAEDIVITANFEEEYTGGPMLVHYWHFNTMTGDEVTEVAPDYSVAGLSALITYPGEGDGYMDARTHRPADPVSNFNLRLGQEPDQGAVLRVRNPADTRELLFEIPSTGYSDLVVTYAVTRSDNGGQFQRFEYSADGGDTWVTVGDDIEVPYIGDGDDAGIYAHVVLDLSDFDEVNNNPDLHFRILSVGEGSDNDSGNQRFDNITLDAVPMIVGEAEKLHIASINEGETVYVDEEFSLLVQAVDGESIPAPVDQDVNITLSVESGSGTLGGIISGVIEEGNTSVLIEGITYSMVESGVVIRAEAEGLEAALSEAFDVIARTYLLTLESYPPGAGELTGDGEYEEGAEVPVTAVAGEGFVFTHWSLDDEEITTDAEFVFTMPAEDVTLTANFDMLGDFLLVHYWHFNNEEMDVEDDYKVVSDFSLVGQGEITYPGEGDGYMDFRTHRESDPVSNYNLRLGEEPDQGAVLRARNPAITRELIIAAPSTGFIDLVVTFATTRTENGAQAQQFYFSADAGNTWVPVGDSYDIPFIEDEEGIYLHKEIDLSEYEEVNDNPDLHFKILFVGEGNDNPSGNNRFDNLTLDGWSIGEVSIEDVVAADITMQVYPNPTHGIFNIDVDQPDMLIRIYDLQGKLVYQRAMSGNTISIDASGFESGLYIIQGISPTGNASVSKRLLVQ